MNQITIPFPVFSNAEGKPLNNGYVYIGEQFLNPELYPVNLYWDLNGEIPAANPLRTINGFIVRNGKAAQVYTPSTYSITVKDSSKRLIYSTSANSFPLSGKSLLDFKAKGDGVSNDTTSFATAVQFCLDNQCALYVPSGTYIINDNDTELAFSEPAGLTMYGDGQTSILRFVGSKGLRLTSTDLDLGRYGINNLWLQAGNDAIEEALTIVRPYVAAWSHPSINIDNLHIGPNQADQASCYFVTGIKTVNGFNTNINSCFIRGKQNDITGMQKGIWVNEQGTATFIRNTQIYFSDSGVYADGTSDWSEGVDFTDGVIVYVDKGIWIDNPGHPQPGHIISKNHINSFTSGVYINGGIQATITENLFYKWSLSDVDGYADIKFSSVPNSIISENSFSIAGASGLNYAVHLLGVSNSNKIANNTTSGRDIGVLIDGTSTANVITDMTSTQDNVGYVPVSDVTAAGVSFFRPLNQFPRSARVFSTASNPTIVTSDWTTLSWSHAFNSFPAAFDVSSPTKLTVPRLTSRVQVGAKVRWDGNATGIRSVRIIKNNSSVIAETAEAPNLLGTPMQLMSAIETVVAGDFFEIQVWQDSGDDRTVNMATLLTYGTLEILQ